jgi:hypothetical protein
MQDHPTLLHPRPSDHCVKLSVTQTTRTFCYVCVYYPRAATFFDSSSSFLHRPFIQPCLLPNKESPVALPHQQLLHYFLYPEKTSIMVSLMTVESQVFANHVVKQADSTLVSNHEIVRTMTLSKLELVLTVYTAGQVHEARSEGCHHG